MSPEHSWFAGFLSIFPTLSSQLCYATIAQHTAEHIMHNRFRSIGIGNAAARTSLLVSKIVEFGSLHFNDFKGRAIVPDNAFCCIGDPTPSS